MVDFFHTALLSMESNFGSTLFSYLNCLGLDREDNFKPFHPSTVYFYQICPIVFTKMFSKTMGRFERVNAWNYSL